MENSLAWIGLRKGGQLETAAGVGLALDVPLLREHGEMVVHVSGRSDTHSLADLSVCRRSIILGEVARDEVQDVPLTVAQYFHDLVQSFAVASAPHDRVARGPL